MDKALQDGNRPRRQFSRPASRKARHVNDEEECKDDCQALLANLLRHGDRTGLVHRDEGTDKVVSAEKIARMSRVAVESGQRIVEDQC